MAKASWCKISPAAGDAGKTEISISADPFTGRISRSTEVALTAVGITDSGTAMIQVTQKPKAEFIAIEEPLNGTELNNVSMSMAIKIKSNCSKLCVRSEQSRTPSGFFMPYTFWMYEINAVDGEKSGSGEKFSVPVAGEYGDSSIELDCGTVGEETEFSLNFPFSVMPNQSIIQRYIRITVFNEAQTVSQTVTLHQDAGAAAISADPDEIELEQDGSAKSVDIQSNAAWSLS